MNERPAKRVCVADIARLIDQIAPFHLSESWDNCGLQVGSVDWEVRKIWIALDPIRTIIEDAGRSQVDMVITHHPLIFRPLKRIDLETFEGKVIDTALKKHIAIYTAHTNLDSAVEGINDILAQKIGLQNLIPMIKAHNISEGINFHDTSVSAGMGRIGELVDPMPVHQWVHTIKKCFGVQYVKVAGNIDQVVHRAAVCSGSGGSLIDTFLDSDAEVFVSGDLRYHDARTVEDAGRTIIDIGHFTSEHLILEPLAKKLSTAVCNAGWDVHIEPCMTERDPITLL